MKAVNRQINKQMNAKTSSPSFGAGNKTTTNTHPSYARTYPRLRKKKQLSVRTWPLQSLDRNPIVLL